MTGKTLNSLIRSAVLKSCARLFKLWVWLPGVRSKQTTGIPERRETFYDNLWRDTARAMGAEVEKIGYGFHMLSYQGQRTFVRGPEVMLDNHLTLKIAGNKPLTYRLLADIPGCSPLPYLEFTIKNIDQAWGFIQSQGVPCVVKPASGTGGGRGVMTGVLSYAQLLIATIRAYVHANIFLVEQEMTGDSYRLLFLNGDYIHAIKRESPTVIGDGKLTIRQLIDQENQRRINGVKITSVSLLEFDLECKNTLKSQELKLNSVPEAGLTVKVKHVVNQNCARENHEVTNQVHPSTIDLGKRVVTAMGCELAGIDIICSDITKPLQDTGGVINEVNTTPGLHHHYLIEEADTDIKVCEIIMAYIFAKKMPLGN